jgi:pyrimidine-specific ribonucleoside hydrolase
MVLPTAAADPKPLIIDTDMTTDDFMAIVYLLNNPSFSVKAITVTGTGFSYCDAGVQVALGMLKLTNYADIPVSCWKDTPWLGGDNPVPTDWRTSMESIKSLNLPTGGKPSDMDAVALFTQTVQDAPDKIEVLALGPLTNLAEAFTKTPALVDKIERITVMGGAVDVAGSSVTDENTTAEWNIYADPPAAKAVFESGAPITLVALDASNDVPVTPNFLSTLKANQKTDAAKFIATALSGSEESINNGGYFFWDPLAAVVMADPKLVTHTERNVTVVDVPGAEYGRTKAVGNGSRIDVVTKPDSKVLEQQLLDAWNVSK